MLPILTGSNNRFDKKWPGPDPEKRWALLNYQAKILTRKVMLSRPILKVSLENSVTQPVHTPIILANDYRILQKNGLAQFLNFVSLCRPI
jgi:hypothetical protein